ncbi:MAG: PKD domain-containing protein [Candidatus Poseidoniaceae archaeon]
MMVQPRVIVLIAVLLLPCFPFSSGETAPSDDFTFSHDHGEVHVEGVFELSGHSNLALNDVAWELIDASTDVTLASGDFLDKVTPNTDATWSWSHNLTVPESGCSCRFVVHHGASDATSSQLVLYLGSGLAWAPVWLNQPMGEVILTDVDNVSLELPLVFPPARANGSMVEMERCPASSNGVCTSPSSMLTAPLLHDGMSTSMTFTPEDWDPEGHWAITSMVVVDAVLARSTSVAWHLLHDNTPPLVAIESVPVANESERVLVVVNATDATSQHVVLVDLRATSPSGEVILLANTSGAAEFIFQPDAAGVWNLQATVQDGAGLTQMAHHALTVDNLAPEAKIRLNGALVENGDTLQVKLGQPLQLDASTSQDTASDLLSLNHVWWIGDDLRLSGVSLLTEERFQDPGTFEVRLEVVDDDGALDEIQFILEVTDEGPPLADAVVVGPLLVVVVGVALGVLFYVRQRSEVADIPTWPSEQER